MLIRLYVDEDAMAGILVRGLRAREIDVTTVFEQEMTGKSDEEQLRYAAEQGAYSLHIQCGRFLSSSYGISDDWQLSCRYYCSLSEEIYRRRADTAFVRPDSDRII